MDLFYIRRIFTPTKSFLWRPLTNWLPDNIDTIVPLWTMGLGWVDAAAVSRHLGVPKLPDSLGHSLMYILKKAERTLPPWIAQITGIFHELAPQCLPELFGEKQVKRSASLFFRRGNWGLGTLGVVQVPLPWEFVIVNLWTWEPNVDPFVLLYLAQGVCYCCLLFVCLGYIISFQCLN